MTAEQPGKIGLWREIQLLWSILLRWRRYRVGDFMRATQQNCTAKPSIHLRKRNARTLDLRSNCY